MYSVMRQESLFDADARSPADARGLMQLLPSTAERLAHTGDAITATRDQSDNARAKASAVTSAASSGSPESASSEPSTRGCSRWYHSVNSGTAVNSMPPFKSRRGQSVGTSARHSTKLRR